MATPGSCANRRRCGSRRAVDADQLCVGSVAIPRPVASALLSARGALALALMRSSAGTRPARHRTIARATIRKRGHESLVSMADERSRPDPSARCASTGANERRRPSRRNADRRGRGAALVFDRGRTASSPLRLQSSMERRDARVGGDDGLSREVRDRKSQSGAVVDREGRREPNAGRGSERPT